MRTVESDLLAGILTPVVLRWDGFKEDPFVASIWASFIIWSMVKDDSLSFAMD